jgi:hypothetical protein
MTIYAKQRLKEIRIEELEKSIRQQKKLTKKWYWSDEHQRFLDMEIKELKQLKEENS